MVAAVNVSQNSAKILHLTKRDVFWFNLTWLNGKLGWKCCRGDFRQWFSPVNTLTLQRCSRTGAFGNSSNHISQSQWLPQYLSYEADVFFQKALNFMQIAKIQYKFQKMFMVFETMAFEHLSGISLNYDENISERQSSCCQTVLRIHISLKVMFSNSVCLGLMET